MPTRPTDDIEWATDGAAELDEPSTGEKQVGWVHNTKPPAHWFNWFQRAYWRWIVYIDTTLGLDSHLTAFIAGDSSATRESLTVTSSATNKGAIKGTGTGTGPGVRANGGTGAAPGLIALGGSGGGEGVRATGGAANVAAIVATGGSNAAGLQAFGSGTGYGAEVTGGSTHGPGISTIGGGSGGNAAGIEAYAETGGDGNGVTALASGSGSGVKGTSAGTGGRGVYGVAGSGNSVGVEGLGSGSGAGVMATGSQAAGIEAYGGGVSSANGSGIFTQGGAANGKGIEAYGVGTGAGGLFDGQGSGTGASDDAIISKQNIKFDGSNPSSSTGFSNRLTPLNVVKAWGCVRTSATTPTVDAGFNISGASYPGGGVTRISFATAMANATYAVMMTLDVLSGWYISARTTTYFEVITFTTNNSTPSDPTGNNITFMFDVLGAQ